MNMSSQLKGMSMKIGSMQAQVEITNALKGATSTMKNVNLKMDIKSIQTTMKEYNKELMKAELGSELVIGENEKYNRFLR